MKLTTEITNRWGTMNMVILGAGFALTLMGGYFGSNGILAAFLIGLVGMSAKLIFDLSKGEKKDWEGYVLWFIGMVLGAFL